MRTPSAAERLTCFAPRRPCALRQQGYQAVAARGELQAGGTAAFRKRAVGLALAVLAVVGATAVVYAGVAGSAERAAVLGAAAAKSGAPPHPVNTAGGGALPSLPLPPSPSLSAVTPQELAEVHRLELVEGEAFMKEDAKGLQDAARLRNAAWLAQHFKSTPELKGLSGEQADARMAALIMQNAVSALEEAATNEQKHAEKPQTASGQALDAFDAAAPIHFNDPFMDNGGFFKVCEDGCSHQEAHQACLKADARLASIHSAADATEAAASCSSTPTPGVFFAEFFFWNHVIDAIPDMKILTPSKTATTTSLTYDDNAFLAAGCPHDRFSARFTGVISIQTEGHYVFYTTSDDGSQLFIGEQMVVNNDGLHPAVKRYGYKYLTPGYWPVTVLFFEDGGGAYLSVSYYGPDTNNAETMLTVAVCSRHVLVCTRADSLRSSST